MGIEIIEKRYSLKILYKSVSFYQFLQGKPPEKLLYLQASLYFIHMREKENKSLKFSLNKVITVICENQLKSNDKYVSYKV